MSIARFSKVSNGLKLIDSLEPEGHICTFTCTRTCISA